MFTPSPPPQLERDDFGCEEHVGDDEYLLGMVRDFVEGDPDATEPCAVCGKPGAPVDALLEEILIAVRKFFEPALNSVPFDGGDWALPVIDTYDALHDLDIDASNPLFEASLGELDDDAPWIRTDSGWPDEYELLRDAWSAFAEHVKHRSRFLFDELPTAKEWGGIDRLGTRDFLQSLQEALNEQPRLEVASATSIYRARSFAEDGKHPSELSDYTSPPGSLASQGRMNPAGIALFYGALEIETAATEVFNGHPYASVATFTPTRTLSLVDLSKVSIPSVFNRGVSRQEHYRSAFLSGFALDIAKSIIRDERIHQEYVPTQVVTEFIRFVLRPSADGVAFASARADGTNVVLFASQEQCLGGDGADLVPMPTFQIVSYGPPSVSLERTITPT